MTLDKFLIGINVRKLRKSKKISQEKLAELVDSSTRTISNIERGIVMPKLQTLYDIAVACGCSLDDFIGLIEGRDNNPPPKNDNGGVENEICI